MALHILTMLYTHHHYRVLELRGLLFKVLILILFTNIIHINQKGNIEMALEQRLSTRNDFGPLNPHRGERLAMV